MALKTSAVFASVIALVAFAATAQSQNTGSNQTSGQSNQAQNKENSNSNNQAQNKQDANQSNSAQNSSSQSNQGSSTQSSSKSDQGTAQTTDRNNTSSSNNAQTQPDRNAQSNQNANSDRNANTNDRSSSRSGTADQRDAVDGQYRGRNAADRSNERNNDRENVDNRSDRDRKDNERSYLGRERGDRDRDRDSDRDRDRSDRDRSDRSNFNRDRDRDMSRDRDRGSRENTRGPDIGLWFNRGSRDGLVISDVSSKGPIAKFGFHEGDRIVSVDGHRVSDEGEFMRYVLHSDRDRVTVVVFRDGREQTIYVEPAVFTEDTESAQVDPLERFGIILDDRYDDRIVVWRVIPRSPAYYAGFHTGDVIVNFGDRPYRTRTEFQQGVSGWKAGDVNVQVRRGENTRQLSVDVPNNMNRSERVAERTDRRADRADRRTDRTNDRSDDRNYNQQNRGRIGGGILNRGR